MIGLTALTTQIILDFPAEVDEALLKKARENLARLPQKDGAAASNYQLPARRRHRNSGTQSVNSPFAQPQHPSCSSGIGCKSGYETI